MKNIKNKNWSRKLTINERLYRISEKLSPPFTIQYIIEGIGDIDVNFLKEQIENLATVIPALKLKQEGRRWTFNGSIPKLIVHNYELPKNWEDNIFKKVLMKDCCEFHLFKASNTTVMFRVLHSAMDGIGGLIVLKRLFELLNGNKSDAILSHFGDNRVRKELKVKPKNKKSLNTFSWKSLDSDLATDHFKTELIQMSYKVDLCISKIAKWYMNETQSAARFLIPVNIRRHSNFEESVSNLSFPIYLNTILEDNEKDIHSRLITELANNNELSKDPYELIIKWIPNSLLKIWISLINKKMIEKNKFLMSGFISDLGFVDLNSLSTSTFHAKDFYSLPVFTVAIPFSVSLCYHQNGTRVAFSIPGNLNSHYLKNSLSVVLEQRNNMNSSTLSNTNFQFDNEFVELWKIYSSPELQKIDANLSFSDHGGDSVDLLTLISEVGKIYVPLRQSDFMMKVLQYGITITPNKMFEIILENKE